VSDLRIESAHQNVTRTITRLAHEHISVTKGLEEFPAQVHKQSLNLCGTVFLSTSLCVCVRVFFFCKTSVKIGCFGLAPLASVNSVYLALWCVFRCLIKLLVLNRVLYCPPLDTVAVQILHRALLLSSSFILK